MISKLSKSTFLIVFALLMIFAFNLGDLNAPRQGTEGFYLQISKEMYRSFDFLTPTYLNHPHFSKPPMHFWFANLFYSFFGNNLLAARMSVLLLCFYLVFLISKILQSLFDIDLSVSLVLFISNFAFIKYSRIYMMDLPMALFASLGALYYYRHWLNQNKRDFLLSALFISCSAMYKGPVALAMVFPPIFMFSLLTKRNFFSTIKWFSLITLLSSSWFIAMGIKHGVEFFNYFFIRENLGKFSSKSYPVSSLIKGLLLFSFPSAIFLPRHFSRYKSIFITRSDPFALFLILNFLASYFIWFIPNQKSFHYAVPGCLYLIILAIYFSKDSFTKFDQFLEFKALKIFYILIAFLLIVLSLFPLFLNWPVPLSVIQISVSICFSALALIAILLKGFKRQIFAIVLLGTIPFISTYSIFTFPLIPNYVVEEIDSSSFAAVYAKPYYLSEILNTDIVPISPDNLQQYEQNTHYKFLLLSKANFDKYSHSFSGHDILAQWPTWKRGASLTEILSVIKNRDISPILDPYIMLKRRAAN